MSSTNSEFYFFLFSLDSFYSFSYPIAVAGISNTTLNKSGKNRHLGLNPAFRENAKGAYNEAQVSLAPLSPAPHTCGF